MDPLWERAEELFHAALGQPEPERETWLAGQTGFDPAVRAEVRSLLAAERKNAAACIGASLAEVYAATGREGSNGLLLHAVYSKPASEGVDECCIWGDYFYLELLARLQLPWRPYW